MEEGFLYCRGHVFIRKCAAQRNYAGAPGGSHLRGTCKLATYSELSHVPTPARFVGWSFRLLRISGNKDRAFKTDLMFVSVSFAD